MSLESEARRCTPGDVGLTFLDAAPDELHELFNKYFAKFAAPITREGSVEWYCYCGRPLSGFLGTFRWGLAYGEGECSGCGAPARAAHDIRDDEGAGLVFIGMLPLLYHPDYIRERKASDESAED